MLKIKDNVDLKELEKFGMSTPMYGACKDVGYENIDGIWILKKDRYIRITESEKARCSIDNRLSDCLYDLIKADLVEKVDE